MSLETLTIRKTARRRSGERGSALLIVFVFAATLAIMLYMELPVAAFEAQRNREQLVIDRGNEYAHAVKLFVRKFGRYPASIEQLESTNNMRFLRERYKDPLTGKDDWRLLHAAPNGQLTDSKVNPIGNTPNGSKSNSSGSSSGTGTFGSSSNNTTSSFGSSSFGSSSSNSNTSNSDSNTGPTEIVTSSLPQRGPAVPANGGGEANASPGDQNLLTPLLTPGQSTAAVQNGPGSPTQPGPPAPQPGQTAAPNAMAGTVLPGTGQSGVTPGDTNGMQTVQNLLNNPNSPPARQSNSSTAPTSSSRAMGVMNGAGVGGVAGVASIAHGQTIKTVNDQSDYSLWEFYYDPSKDTNRGLGAAMQGLGGQAAPGATQPGGPQSPYAGGRPVTPASPSAPTPNPPQN